MSDDMGKKTAWLAGKEWELGSLREQFSSVGLLNNPSARKIVRSLAEATEPLSIASLSEGLALPPKQVSRLVRRLLEAQMVASLTLGGRTLYYVLTVYGVRLARSHGITAETPKGKEVASRR